MGRTNTLRTGISTGTCAAAASRAAVMLLAGKGGQREVEIQLPSREYIRVDIAGSGLDKGKAWAMVRKDAGDDPDETHGMLIGARVSFSGKGVVITGGKGVGRVTRPGLAIEPGNPAINPVPLKMIRCSVSGLYAGGLAIEIFAPDGERLARKTFNERLGIMGGISILGTSGIVRPFSVQAIKETIRVNIRMVVASGYSRPVMVPGRIGLRAAIRLGYEKERIVEVSNEWEFALAQCAGSGAQGMVVAGHPGKLLKFVRGEFETHSSKSGPATAVFQDLASGCLNREIKGLNTVEHGIQGLDHLEKKKVGEYLALRVKNAVLNKIHGSLQVRVFLVDLQGDVLGRA